MFVQVAGGRLQLQRDMQNVSEGCRLDVFTQGPFTCLRRFVPSKAPDMQDVNELQWGVAILCVALPVLSFIEMFCSLEATLAISPASAAKPYLAISAPGVATFVRIMEVTLILMGMSALRGLQILVQTVNPKDTDTMSTTLKQIYCQTFLAGLRLLPILCHLWQCVWGGEAPVVDSHNADLVRSIIVCAFSMVCTGIALKAFPADDSHYPKNMAADAAASSALKPVLDQVKFCPFCGSGDLELEVDESSGDCATCPRCCARHVPLHLVIHRGGQTSAVGFKKGSAASGLQHDLAEN